MYPIYYCVRRGLTDEQLDTVASLLRITPVLACVIFDVHDNQAALKLSQQTMKTDTEELAHKLARRIAVLHSQPLVVMGTCDLIEAYFPDGSHQRINADA